MTINTHTGAEMPDVFSSTLLICSSRAVSRSSTVFGVAGGIDEGGEAEEEAEEEGVDVGEEVVFDVEVVVFCPESVLPNQPGVGGGGGGGAITGSAKIMILSIKRIINRCFIVNLFCP